MTKTILSLVAVFLVTSSVSFADNGKAKQKSESPQQPWSRPYGVAGCGFGSVIVGKGGSQISASSTNSSTDTQLFGITSGTSNCVDNPNDEVAYRMDRFVTVNIASVASDISRGSGDTISSISHLMGCSNSVVVGHTLQGKFDDIFPTYKVAPNMITDSIISAVKTSKSLAQQCKNII